MVRRPVLQVPAFGIGLLRGRPLFIPGELFIPGDLGQHLAEDPVEIAPAGDPVGGGPSGPIGRGRVRPMVGRWIGR